MSAVLPLEVEAGVDRPRAAGIALWFFIAVACTLFGLFFAAYVMRLESAEGYPLALPWQFGLSTALLLAGSLALELAWRAPAARWRLLAGGLCGAAFVAVQLWGWSALLDAKVVPAGNPAASFLYLLTAMHGLHVLGGLGGWCFAWRDPGARWRIALCARYWHFLLLLWLGLYALLGLLTPDLVRALCGTR
ncbi:MAG TPA: bb3-type cytochrome oxidase subunit III [Roseateles sp.]|nr:bb3-type cytochrome oxidase subunit III [Roseateles sp.]